MEAIIIIASAIVVVGLALYIHHKIYYGENDESKPQSAEIEQSEDNQECCGMHIVCEKDSLLASVSNEIVYYDDEELDEFAGRQAGEYSDDEIELFRDVLLTLRPEDIAGWARSIQLRKINLPTEIRDELIMIVSEARNKRQNA